MFAGGNNDISTVGIGGSKKPGASLFSARHVQELFMQENQQAGEKQIS
jgi:hypothetical protein